MSMATSYRYEAMTEKKSLKNALHRQEERIRTDEMMASRQQQARQELQINLKSAWNECLEQAATVQKAKSDSKQSKAELHTAHRASIMVRQAALRQLLEADYHRFERELHCQGKAFYIQRT